MDGMPKDTVKQRSSAMDDKLSAYFWQAGTWWGEPGCVGWCSDWQLQATAKTMYIAWKVACFVVVVLTEFMQLSSLQWNWCERALNVWFVPRWPYVPDVKPSLSYFWFDTEKALFQVIWGLLQLSISVCRVRERVRMSTSMCVWFMI